VTDRTARLRPAGAGGPVLVPYWLTGADRDAIAAAIQVALEGPAVHPVAAIHLQDVLTELHAAAVRDAVWPASSERVRRATGWAADVLPVRLSAGERAGVLALDTLPAGVRAVLDGGTA
jgi:hypothetical protein